MNRTSTLLFSTLITLSATAQNWTVGVPVDMLLYTQTFYGGCAPNADYSFTFPMSPVSGVQYKVLITAMEPANGSLSITPGLPNGGLNDVMAFDATVQRTLAFASGTTSAVLEFRATGVPTTDGQVHPCGPSQFWISNLMLCPEGLTPLVDDGCTVQAGSTSITGQASPDPTIQWPSALNGQRLTIDLSSFETATASVVDMSGRTTITRQIGRGSALDLSMLSSGAYVLNLVRSNGSVMTKRFHLGQQ